MSGVNRCETLPEPYVGQRSTNSDRLVCPMKRGRAAHLQSALQCENWKKAKKLIWSGVDMDYRHLHGESHLHLSVSLEITTLLIKKGADINAVDDRGFTPLHISVFLSRTDLAAVLLYYNADPSITNDQGLTPLMFNLGSFHYSEMTELLLNYESNFDSLSCHGTSVFTRSLIQNRYTDVLIEHGAYFGNLFYDVMLLMWCAHRMMTCDFKWLWNSFKYKECWDYDISILDCLLDTADFELFNYVIESPKITDVIEVTYADIPEKQNLPSYKAKDFSLVNVLKATYLGYSKKDAENAIFILLSNGYIPVEQDFLDIYEMWGCCEVLDLLLHLDIQQRGYIYCPLIPKVLLYPERRMNTMISRFLKSKSRLTEKSLLMAISYIYDHSLIEAALRDCYFEKDFILELCDRRLPSLVELCRNKARFAIWKRFRINKACQFYSVVRWLRLPPVIEDILLFKMPLYGYKRTLRLSTNTLVV